MAVNLSRNTKVYFTTYNVDPSASGFILPASEAATSYIGTGASANIWEVTVLDGYSFSQGTDQQTITLSEAGTAPIRGSRSFNSKLNAAEWSLSTYIRPYLNGSSVVSAPERHFWNAIFGSKAINTTAVAGTSTVTTQGNTTDGYTIRITKASHGISVGDSIKLTGVTGLTVQNSGVTTDCNGIFKCSAVTTGTFDLDLETFTAPTGTASGSGSYYEGQWYQDANGAYVTAQGSNKNSLQAFALLFLVDNVWYKVYNCAVNQANISFDINGIATIEWTGFGTQVNQLTGATFSSSTALTAGGATSGYVAVDSAASKYISNKLSTTTVVSNIGGVSGTTYTVPITGGNITINNNIEYLTPENLGVVNKSIGYYTGTREITGSLNAYLKTGSASESGKLLSDILSGLATTSETKFKLQVELGGSTNTTRVEFLMNGCQLQVPTIDIQDVVATTINFTAQGYDTPGANGVYNIARTNNLAITYKGV